MTIRTYKVTLDSKNSIAPEPVFLRQGDKTGAVVIDATLMDNGSPVSLSGLTPMFKANTADGQAVIADSTGFNIVNDTGGKFTYQVPNALSSVPGKITTAYFSLSDAHGSESTFDVAFIIKKAVDITHKQADDYITIIDGTLKTLQQKIDAMSTDVQTILNAFNQGNFYNKTQTDSKDAATLESAKSYADSGDSNALYNAKNYTDNSLSGIVALPETFANLAAIQAKYPNGANGIMVAADNGHKYIWANNVWTDAGVYQSVGIADGSITADKIKDDSLGIAQIDEVNLNDVHDSYLSINSATSWNGTGTISRSGRTITETSDGGDHGIVLQAHLNRIPAKDENVYLNFDYRMPDITNMTGAFEVYLMNKAGSIRQPNIISAEYTSIAKHRRYSINGQFFINFNLDEKFKILFAVHGHGTLEVINPLLNWTDRKISPFAQFDQLASDDSDGINDFYVSPAKVGQGDSTKMASVWGSGGIISYDSDELIFVQNSDGNSGCLVPIKIDASKPVYINFDLSFVGGAIEFYVLNDTQAINTSKKLGSADNASMKRFNYTLEPQFFNELGITTTGYLLFVVHKNNACFRLRNLSISNTALVGNQQYFDNETFAQLGARKIERIGDPMLTDRSNESVNKIDKIHFGTPNCPVSIDNAKLDSISVSVPTAGTYTFQAAMIDQHQLIVAGKEFTVPLSAGYNVVNCRDKAIYLEKGSYLMMDLSGLGGLYPTSSTPLMSDALIQDETHMSDVVGYTGMIMYSIAGTLPFSYEVVEKPLTDKIVDLNQNVETINDKLAGVDQSGNDLYVKDANGKKYRLFVDENGVLSVVSQMPNKVAIFGNSLTKEHGGIGMAASDSNHDWYHIVTEYIRSKNKNVVINERTNVSGWESSTTSDARQVAFESLIKPYLSSDTDLVIIQLVDNVNTDDKKATFAKDAQSLLSNIHVTSPKARILWVARWFGDDTLLDEVKTACSTQNATLIDITSITSQSGVRSTVGATRTGIDGTSWQITSTGEAAHPGDLGMQKIAEAVEEALNF